MGRSVEPIGCTLHITVANLGDLVANYAFDTSIPVHLAHRSLSFGTCIDMRILVLYLNVAFPFKSIRVTILSSVVHHSTRVQRRERRTTLDAQADMYDLIIEMPW